MQKYKGIELLNENNYESWNIKLQNYAVGQEWTRTVFDIEVPPAVENEAFEAWQTRNDQCLAFLSQTISATQLLVFKGVTSAREIWRSLEQRYDQQNEQRQILLFSKICSLRWEPYESLRSYLTRNWRL